MIEGLAKADDAARGNVMIEAGGDGLRWPALDLDMTVPGLVVGLLGTQKYMARLAGRAKSKAKAVAARQNGKKGGRPRKLKAA
jgi:hypothetical protein